MDTDRDRFGTFQHTVCCLWMDSLQRKGELICSSDIQEITLSVSLHEEFLGESL